jgi:hypothetical protein
MLKGPERERYDHFMRNGFPKWRGSGYYYQRFRPGLGSVLFGLLVVMGGGMHYFALLVSWRRRREFVQRYIRHARKTAWGDETAIQGIPGVDASAAVNTQQWDEEKEKENDSGEDFVPRNRREKRAIDKESKKGKKTQAARTARVAGISAPMEAEITSGPQGAKKRIVAQNGKVLIVDSVGNVFLEEETEDGVKGEFLLDVSVLSVPHIQHKLIVPSPMRNPHPPSSTPCCSSCPALLTTSPSAASSTSKSSSRNRSWRHLTFPKRRLPFRMLQRRTSTVRRGSARRRRGTRGSFFDCCLVRFEKRHVGTGRPKVIRICRSIDVG